MADKKITALTEMLASGKDDSVDLLHIIDYSASPVNKKIKLVNLFSTIETPITAYGAHTHDFGPTSAISGLSVVIPNVVPANTAETEVIVNDDGSAYVDFRVQTSLNDNAIFVDSSLDSGAGNCNTITINGGAIASTKKVDFNINSSTGVLFHTDSTDHVVGVGTTTPDTAYLLDVAAVGGKSIKAAGSIDITGSIDTTGITTTSTVAHTAAGAIPITARTVNMTVSGTIAYTLADGGDGQEITLTCVAATSTPDGTITPASRNGFATLDMDAVGETFHLIFTNSKWNIVSYYAGGVT